MSERYSKLFALPEELYCQGAPAVIAAGALQKDNQTGRVFAQIKLRNVQNRMIKAATVRLTLSDTAGKPLGQAEHQFLDLDAPRDGDCAQKEPVPMKDPAVRSFTAEVTEVVFADNGSWTASGGAWEPLPQRSSLEDALQDGELVKQYRMKYGAESKFTYQEERGLWRCSCGALNLSEEKECHSCKASKAALESADMKALAKERDQRLEEEAQRAQEAKAAAAAQAEKVKKVLVIAVPIAIVLIVAGVLISGHMKKVSAYNEAVALVEAHEFDDAMDAFAALEGFRDSQEQAQQGVAYEKALYIISCAENGDKTGTRISTRTHPVEESSGGNAAGENWEIKVNYDLSVPVACYRRAEQVLSQLGDYKDSAQLLETVREQANATLYQEGMDALEEQDYEEAYNILSDLGDYQGSAEIAQQLMAENRAVEKAYDAYWQGDLEPFMKVIQENKYVTVSETDKKNVEFLYPMTGKWTAISGDSIVFSIRGNDPSKYVECPTVESSLKFTNSKKPYISFRYGNGKSLGFYVNFEKQNLNEVTSYVGGDLRVEFNSNDRFTVYVERSDRTLSCVYQRA